MRALMAILAASILLASGASAVPIGKPLPRHVGPTVLQITQLKTMFSRFSAVNVQKAGTPVEQSATTTPSSADKAGNPAYITGGGVALTPANMSNPATDSHVDAEYCSFQPQGVLKTDDGSGLVMTIPSPTGGVGVFPMLMAEFHQLPLTERMYTLTLTMGGDISPNNLRVEIGDQQFKGADLKCSGDTIGILFTYNAGPYNFHGTACDNGGRLYVRAFYDLPSGVGIVIFYSMQLAQIN